MLSSSPDPESTNERNCALAPNTYNLRNRTIFTQYPEKILSRIACNAQCVSLLW